MPGRETRPVKCGLLSSSARLFSIADFQLPAALSPWATRSSPTKIAWHYLSSFWSVSIMRLNMGNPCAGSVPLAWYVISGALGGMSRTAGKARSRGSGEFGDVSTPSYVTVRWPGGSLGNYTCLPGSSIGPLFGWVMSPAFNGSLARSALPTMMSARVWSWKTSSMAASARFSTVGSLQTQVSPH